MINTWKALFATGRIGWRALGEQQTCIRDVHARLAPYLKTPEDTPDEFSVQPAPLPKAWLEWRKNIFSTLFQSVYHLMEIPEPRRLLYGKLICLFRIWVTSADNLLDEEDKDVVAMKLPGSARIMRQVIGVMAADRVLAELLREEVEKGTITAMQSRDLSRESLCRLLPSAAQEASEEGGITVRPPPEEVLQNIHRLKTGLLFNLAFVGPDRIEPGQNRVRTALLREGLMQIGLGCQLLDDIRDMARDLLEHRHNYVLSALAHEEPTVLERLTAQARTPADRLYLSAPHAVLPTARRGFDLLSTGLRALGDAGLGFDKDHADQMARAMFGFLDLEDLPYG